MSAVPWRTQEGSRQGAETGREGQEVAPRRPPRAPLGHPLPEGRVPLRRLRGLGERGYRLPNAWASLAQPKKRTTGARERDEFLKLLWRKELGRVDPSGLVFVDEMGTHTSLAPLYAYSPVGERAYFEIPRNLKARTPRCLRACASKGWDRPWPYEEALHPECLKPPWKRCWLPPYVRDR